MVVISGAGCAKEEVVPRPWPKGAKVGDEVVGPDGGTMVWVPAGEFTMGSSTADAARANHGLPQKAQRQGLFDNERPAHRVSITRGFWIGKYLVTGVQYRRFCRATGAGPREALDEGDDRPVRCMSWDNAQAYCHHYGLRLPTEAEWEYAARGPEGHSYPWGNDWDAGKCCNADSRECSARICSVGGFPDGASWCGALDMVGLVSQWCQDWFSSDYYAASPSADPPGPTWGDLRVVRGGYYAESAPFLRCARRSSCRTARVVELSVGIRCVR
jgi:formylglycine-generating enzyme required for sulfatase activity